MRVLERMDSEHALSVYMLSTRDEGNPCTARTEGIFVMPISTNITSSVYGSIPVGEVASNMEDNNKQVAISTAEHSGCRLVGLNFE